ncbi:hypothetical protein SERLA73DRAFT_182703, partial [Serpula lacrymans var. lacrymans S7.3]
SGSCSRFVRLTVFVFTYSGFELVHFNQSFGLASCTFSTVSLLLFYNSLELLSFRTTAVFTYLH